MPVLRALGGPGSPGGQCGRASSPVHAYATQRSFQGVCVVTQPVAQFLVWLLAKLGSWKTLGRAPCVCCRVCFNVCVCVLAYRNKRGNTETLTTGGLQMVRLCVIFLFYIYQWPVFFKILQYKLSLSCWCLKDNPQKKKKEKKREKKQADLLICNACQFPWCKYSHYGSF